MPSGSLVAVTPQLTKYSRQLVKKLGLTFPVLSDTGNKVAAQFGLVFSLPEDLRQVYKGFGIDLERFNGDASWTLAMPARFILDRQGTVIDAAVHPDYTIRPEPSSILPILQNISR
jgi:peroxiredoxin